MRDLNGLATGQLDPGDRRIAEPGNDYMRFVDQDGNTLHFDFYKLICH